MNGYILKNILILFRQTYNPIRYSRPLKHFSNKFHLLFEDIIIKCIGNIVYYEFYNKYNKYSFKCYNIQYFMIEVIMDYSTIYFYMEGNSVYHIASVDIDSYEKNNNIFPAILHNLI